VEKRIYIRVPDQLLKDFDRACEVNYTSKSEVLRRAMLDYVRENEGGSEMKTKKYGNVALREFVGTLENGDGWRRPYIPQQAASALRNALAKAGVSLATVASVTSTSELVGQGHNSYYLYEWVGVFDQSQDVQELSASGATTVTTVFGGHPLDIEIRQTGFRITAKR
jgi:hypothetical protein